MNKKTKEAPRQNKKLSTVMKVVITLTLVMIVCFFLAFVLIGISMPAILEQKYLSDYTINETKPFDITSVEKISIDSVESDITFIDSNEAKVVLHGTAKGAENMELPQLEISKVGDELEIKVNYPSNPLSFNFQNENLKMDIYLPKSYKGQLDVETVSGDLKIKDCKFESFDFESVSGDLSLKSVLTPNFNAQSVSGDIAVEEIIGKAKVETISGDVTLGYKEMYDDLEITTVSGDVLLSLPSDTNAGITYETASGKIESDLKFSKHDDKYVLSIGTPIHTITVSTVSGDLKIKR